MPARQLIYASDGRKFGSITEAAKLLGVGTSAVCQDIDKGYRCQGVKLKRVGPARLLKCSDGSEYRTIDEALDSVDIGRTTLVRAIKTGRPTRLGQTWKWEDVA